MFRSNCNASARAHVSLFALLIIGLTLLLALTQSRRIGFSIKADALSQGSRSVEALLLHGLERVRTETSADSGMLPEGDLNLIYRRTQAGARFLTAVRITVRADGDERLPKPAGLWIDGLGQTMLIKDYGRE